MFYAISGWMFIILSLGSMFARERVWPLYDWYQRRRGPTYTRTENWELRISIFGMLGLLAGIILVMLSLGS